MSIDNCLSKLEAMRGAGPIVIWHQSGETEEQARLRWSLENPGRDATQVDMIGWAANPAVAQNG